jgi:hypothetical protein
MKIATPYKAAHDIGEPDRQRVMKHLILEITKIYENHELNGKLYS